MTGELNVLVVTNTYPTEQEPGATPCIKDQIDVLRAQGINVNLLYIDRHNKLNYFKAMLRIFMTNFGRKRYDLIHAHYGHSGWVARAQFRAPVVVTFHGSDLLGSKDSKIGKPIAGLVDGVIVMSEEMKQVSGRQDAHVIPFGVDVSLFHTRIKDEIRRDLGLPLNEKLILFPWNPARTVKRFDVIQAALEILKQEHPEARLVVVFNQSRETIAKYMSACDAMVLASNHEGSPVAVREALASGLPVVSVDVGDIRQLIEDIDGCALAERDPQDLADKLGQVLSRGTRLNIEEFEGKIDAAGAARRVMEVYTEMLDEAPPGQIRKSARYV